MSDENTVAPVAETQNPAAETADQSGVAEPNTTADVDPPKVESDEPKPEKTAEQRELEYLRRKATKADRANAKLYQELDALRKTQPSGEPKQGLATDPEDIERVVTERAREIAEAERLNDRCNAIVEKGRKDFPDFAVALSEVSKELPLFDRGGPTPALHAVLDADNPAAVLHYLGKHLDIASELSELTPTQLTRRLVRIEDELAKPTRQPSKAPTPLEPVKPRASEGEPDPRDTKKWNAWYEKQLAAKRNR